MSTPKREVIKCRLCKADKPRSEFQPDQGDDVSRMRHVFCVECRAKRKHDPKYRCSFGPLVDPDRHKKMRAQQNLYAAENASPCSDPCWMCGSTSNVDRHHIDYNKPLEFIPLCRSCHIFIHKHRCGMKTPHENYIEYVMATNANSRDVSTNERDVLRFSPSTTIDLVTESRA